MKDGDYHLLRVLLTALAIPAALLAFRYVSTSWTRKYPLPPGPKPLPLFGNIFDIPSKKQWLVYDEWFKKYGDMVFVYALNKPMLVLGSTKRAQELLDHRSSICASRPHLTMALDLVGFNTFFAFQPYGPRWRQHRRQFHQFFHLGVVDKYMPIQIASTKVLLQNFATSPENFIRHIRHAFATTIMKISYDIDVRDNDDKYISLAEDTLHILSITCQPGMYLVDMLPILKYVPDWIPGAAFKRQAAVWSQTLADFMDLPFQAVQDALRRGENPSCMAAELIEKLPTDEGRQEQEQIARNVCGNGYAGGADTTVSAVQTFLLAMIHYPHVQKKAQAEIDTIVGSGRLPDFDDRPMLPYVHAIAKETMRWQLVLPLAVVHATTEDQVYDGYFIPKGTMLVGNSWSILHDPVTYPEPEEFRPERYLKDGELNPDMPDPGSIGAFGFGRRICPGKHLSDNSLYNVISSVLSVFDIKPAVGEDGRDILPPLDYTSGVISWPKPFKCSIKPRSTVAADLISSLSTGSVIE